MECGICFESFNAVARMPKVLSCGHTYCLACLKKLADKKCPQDATAFSTDPLKLPSNFLVLQMISGASSTSRSGRRFWCRDCCRVADEACMEDHTVTSAAPALRGRLQALAALAAEQVEQLQQPQHLDQVLQVLLGPAASCSVAFKDKHRDWQVELQLPAASAAATDSMDPLRLSMLTLLAASWPKSEAPGDSKALPGPASALCVERPPLGEVGETVDIALLSDGQREALLHSPQLKEVRRVVGLRGDMLGCLQLLQLVAPHLEELQLHDCRRPQLQVVLTMPRLHRLELWNCSDDLWRNPFSLPPREDKPPPSQEKLKEQQVLQEQLRQLQQQLQQHQLNDQVRQVEQELQRKLRQQELEEQRHQRLKWLRVGYLPYGLTMSLITEHKDSLEKLWLLVGTGGSLQWPYTCHGAIALVPIHQLKAANREIVLMRGSVVHDGTCSTCSSRTSICYGLSTTCCKGFTTIYAPYLKCECCNNIKIEPF